MQYDVLCAGLATFDMLVAPVSLDIMTSDGTVAEEVRTGSGGDAVNSAISMAKLGVRVCVSGCVGADSFADRIQADLERAGASAEGLVRDSALFTNSPIVLLDSNGERHIIRTAKGGTRFFNLSHIPDHLLASAKHLHIASVNMLPKLDGAPLAELFARAHALGMTTSMDASFDKEGLWMKKIEDVLPNCDIFIPSLQEASKYAGSDSIEEITACFSRFHLKYFGIKLGAQGVYVTDFKHSYRMPSLYQGKPVDTTGAGDAFFAGFLAGYIKGYDLPSCAALGSAQSASVMRGIGANQTAGNWEDARALLEQAGYTLKKEGGTDL